MSAQTLTVTGVVEQMLGHAAQGRWEALDDLLDENFEIVEPYSLPYGGTHHRLDGYVDAWLLCCRCARPGSPDRLG